jgi:excisionase family DNA binding protein
MLEVIAMNYLTDDEMLCDGLERISEAARYLGMSRSHIYRLIRNGVLPSVKIGKSRRVPVRAVRDLALENMVSVSNEADAE